MLYCFQQMCQKWVQISQNYGHIVCGKACSDYLENGNSLRVVVAKMFTKELCFYFIPVTRRLALFSSVLQGGPFSQCELLF